MTESMELREKVEEALARFPYHKAAALYQVMNWRWCGSDLPPEEEEVRAAARKLALEAEREFLSTGASTRSSSGGLVVSIWRWSSAIEVEVLMAPFSESAYGFCPEGSVENEEQGHGSPQSIPADHP